jgi:hypothetical protein
MIDVYDEFSIRRLIASYCYCLDQRRFTDLGALFAADGTWEAQYGSSTGPDGIAAFLADLVPAEPKRRHFVSNILIEAGTDGRAEATSYYMVVRDGSAGPMVSVAGTYYDCFARGGDGLWKFTWRKLEPAILGDLGLTR